MGAKVGRVVADGDVSPDPVGRVSDLDSRLLKAAREGRLKEVKELLQSNANIEVHPMQRFFDKQTPLHYASEYGHRDIVDLLLEQKADIEAKNFFQTTPLHLAAKGGHRDIVDLLLEQKADIEAKDRHQGTPLHYASYSDQKEVVTLLLKKGADLGAQHCDARSALCVIFDRSLGPESFGRLLVEKDLWSRSVLVAIIKSDNQDSILNLLKSWPQNAWKYVGSKRTELKRASVPRTPAHGVGTCVAR